MNRLFCLLVVVFMIVNSGSCAPHWHSQQFGGYGHQQGRTFDHGYHNHGNFGPQDEVVVVIVEEQPQPKSYRPQVIPQYPTATHTHSQQPEVYHFTIIEPQQPHYNHHHHHVPQQPNFVPQNQPQQPNYYPQQRPQVPSNNYPTQRPSQIPSNNYPTQRPTQDYLPPVQPLQPPVQDPARDYLPPWTPVEEPSNDYLPPLQPGSSTPVPQPPSNNYLPPSQTPRPNRGSNSQINEDVLVDEIFGGNNNSKKLDDCPTCTNIDIRGFV